MAEVRREITGLLAEIELGRKDALDRLMPFVYRELRRIAGRQICGERVDHTLEPAANVHEVYLRFGGPDPRKLQEPGAILCVAAQLMRRMVVDDARRRHAAKRGTPVTLNQAFFPQGPGGFFAPSTGLENYRMYEGVDFPDGA